MIHVLENLSVARVWCRVSAERRTNKEAHRRPADEQGVHHTWTDQILIAG